MTQDEMRRIISDAGYTPVQRRTLYDACTGRLLRVAHPDAEEPARHGLPIHGADLDSNLASA